jgi:FlaG/FlaF family flagellin (archaellin)
MIEIGILNSIVFLFFTVTGVDMRKGVSEVVSFVLIVAIMITATMSAYVWASSNINSINEPGRIKNLMNQMIALDGVIKSVAHGDVNFTSRFELYYPDGYFELRNTTANASNNLMPVLIIRQNAMVLGYANVSATGCGTNYSYDSSTHTTLFRYTTTDNVYVGAQANGPGQAEMAICYTSVNISYGGTCLRGKSGPFAAITIRKEGVTGSVPVVSMDVC